MNCSSKLIRHMKQTVSIFVKHSSVWEKSRQHQDDSTQMVHTIILAKLRWISETGSFNKYFSTSVLP